MFDADPNLITDVTPFSRHIHFYNADLNHGAHDWNSHLNNLISQNEFLSIVTRDIPLDTQVTVNLTGGTQCSMEMSGSLKGFRCILDVEDVYIYLSDTYESSIRIKEVALNDTDDFKFRGTGIGKIFLDNMVTLAERLGVSKIQLRAGRSDGPIFWALHGFDIELPNGSRNFKQVFKDY